ncbi:MAG: hemolysin family protein [Nitrospinota bacterium]|nr:hemolysin family protein [Nitrospinota bacterium]
MEIITLLGICFFLLCAEALFAGSEIALISADRVHLQAKASSGHYGSKVALELLEKPEWLMGTILICHNLCFVTNVSLVTFYGIEFAGSKYGEIISFLIIVPILIIFGEVIPKSFCRERANILAPSLASMIWYIRKILFPIIWLLSILINFLIRLLGGGNYPSTSLISRKELELMIDEERRGDVREVEKTMIRKIFSFRDLDVSNVMVPMIDASVVSFDGKVQSVVDRIYKDGHSRILIYRENTQNIIGIVHAKDLISSTSSSNDLIIENSNLMRPVYFVPESKSANDLLYEMMNERNKLAVVVDEYGACVGIVTLEDLVEEVVGEISDEYDWDENRKYSKIGEKGYIIDARIEIEIIREQLMVPIPLGDYETLSGFLLDQFEKIPSEGDEIRFENWLITIDSVSDRQIEFVRFKETSSKDLG